MGFLSLPDKWRDEDWTEPVTCSIIVSTCGDAKWRDLANERAIPSAEVEAQAEGVNLIVYHFPHVDSVARARNLATVDAGPADWLCFLDADDELEPGYLAALERRYDRTHGTAPMLLVPAVRYTRLNSPPAIPNRGRWPAVNECVIGTLVPHWLFKQVGGFREATDDGTPISIYEDWDLWLRCYDADAILCFAPDAVYRAHGGPGGNARNLGLSMKGNASDVYDAIWRDHLTRTSS